MAELATNFLESKTAFMQAMDKMFQGPHPVISWSPFSTSTLPVPSSLDHNTNWTGSFHANHKMFQAIWDPFPSTDFMTSGKLRNSVCI